LFFFISLLFGCFEMNGTATSPAKPPPLLDGHEREPMVGPDAARNGGGGGGVGGGGGGLTPRGGPEFPNMQQTFLAPPPTPHVVVFYLLALCIGFIVPWHWFYLAWSLGRAVGPGGGGGGFALEAGRSSGAEAHLHTMRRAGRNDALTQAALYLASLALFFAFRMPMLPWVRDCPGGKGMSVSCLFQHQVNENNIRRLF
jgi:hypothetical protein